jgi:NADH-quinone oxidoreductase E subunit
VTDKNSKLEIAAKRAEELKKQYPNSRSAIMPVLYLAQEVFGYISDEAVSWVSKIMDIPPVQVMEVATFYTMYYKKPVGKYHFQICRTLSCAVCGMCKLTEALHKRFGVVPGEVTADGMWSYEEVECLGSCGTAPMCQINDIYFEKLDAAKLNQIIDKIELQKPELRYSTLTDTIGEGLAGFARSEVI